MGWVGWDEENERSDHSLPPSLLQFPELQRGLGLGKREALPWWRVNETFSFVHEKNSSPTWRWQKEKLWLFGSWLKAENGEMQTGRKLGKNVKPLHLCTPLCPSYEVITPNHIHPSWKKKFCQYVVWNHLWVVKAEGFLKCFLYIFFCIFQNFQNKTCILL